MGIESLVSQVRYTPGHMDSEFSVQRVSIGNGKEVPVVIQSRICESFSILLSEVVCVEGRSA